MILIATNCALLMLYILILSMIVSARFPTPQQCISDSDFCKCFEKKDGRVLQCQDLKNTSDLLKLTTDLWEPLVTSNVIPGKSKGPVYSEFQIIHSKLANISHQVLQNICYFKTLNLSYNSIINVESKTFSCNITERLEELDLSNNNLSEVTNWFTRPSNLKMLYLERNQLNTIKNNGTAFLGHLQALNLSFNAFTEIKIGYFCNMTSLKMLTLAHNKLQSIEKDSLKELINLSSLDLSCNHIQDLDADVFLPLRKLTQLSLAHNQLTILGGNVFQVPSMLRELHLEGNPWACNDSLSWLYHSLQVTSLDLSPNTTRVLCFSPQDMQNRSVHDWMNIKRIEESFHNISICHICQCYVDRDKIAGGVNCQGKGLTQLPEKIPNYTKIVHMENNRIKMLAPNSEFLAEWQNVLYLYLGNNTIESLKGIEGTRLMQNLALLQLTKNRLKEIPIHILDQFSTTLHNLYLGDNPWICDCNTVRFQSWIRLHYKQVKDVEKIHCGPDGATSTGQVIYKLMKSDLCPQAGEGINYLDILNVVMAILIVTILSKLIIDYWWQKRTGKLPHFFSFRLH